MKFEINTLVKAWYKSNKNGKDYELFVKTDEDCWLMVGYEAFWVNSDEELIKWANEGWEILALPVEEGV